MSKYVRHSSVVSRQADQSIDEDHWLKRFQDNLVKDAVQPRDNASLFDQINSIMNGSKSKYTSVDAAVKEMQERSGLTAYLNNVKVSEDNTEDNKKVTASDNQPAIDKKVDLTPVVIKKHPPIKMTLENYIRDTKGNLPVPAIIEKIRSIHQKDCSDAKDWDDDKLIRLVSRLNLGAKKSNYSNYEDYNNLGVRDVGNSTEVDPSNTDAFFALTPAKI
jgi:hypothetical protein